MFKLTVCIKFKIMSRLETASCLNICASTTSCKYHGWQSAHQTFSNSTYSMASQSQLLCVRPRRAEALSHAFVWRLSVVYIGPNSRTERLKTKIGTEVAHVTRDSSTPVSRSKGQLADVLNSQHAGIGATWWINTDIVMPEQPRHLANKYKDTVNLQGTEALWRPPAYSLFAFCFDPLFCTEANIWYSFFC